MVVLPLLLFMPMDATFLLVFLGMLLLGYTFTVPLLLREGDSGNKKRAKRYCANNLHVHLLTLFAPCLKLVKKSSKT
jgi:hypothetical protein